MGCGERRVGQFNGAICSICSDSCTEPLVVRVGMRNCVGACGPAARFAECVPRAKAHTSGALYQLTKFAYEE